MAKLQSLEALASATKTNVPIRRNPGILPSGSLLVRKPKGNGPELSPELTEDIPVVKYGQHIYTYKNIRTNQVVYSMKRHLDNHAAISQLPFLGKKTVPARLRKDLWTPFWLCTFPNPSAGQIAYRRLREFRRLHETKYPVEEMRDPKNPAANLSKREKGKKLMDQKANSVADLAAVLLLQNKGPSAERIARYERQKAVFDRWKKQGSKRVKRKTGPLDVGTLLNGTAGVEVFWSDVADAEFAVTWPADVVHHGLRRSHYTAAWPAVEVAADLDEDEEDEGGEEAGEQPQADAKTTAEAPEGKQGAGGEKNASAPPA